MKRLAVPLCAGLLLLGLVPGAALATLATLDQSYTSVPDSFGGGSLNLAQTFTAGMTGSLVEVDLWMNGDGAHPITVTIESTSGGKPTGTVLATSESGTPPTGDGGWTSFSFSAPYSETAGTTYAILFSCGDYNAVWGSLGGGTSSQQAEEWEGSSWGTVAYPRGYLGDFAFETWVEAAAASSPTSPPACRTAAPTASPTASPTATPTLAPPDLVSGAGGQPAAEPTLLPLCTPPPTGTASGGSSKDSTPLVAVLICLAFGGLGLAAVETQRWRIRG